MTEARITATEICAAMSKKWCQPEWAIMWEVADATGGNARRRADAIMMSLWPSRGLELHGVEIKISRADWRREALDPTKAESIAKFCDRWYVHTSPGIITDLSEVPPAWGVREWNGKAWRTVKEAEKTEAAPLTRAFLAAMLRRADETMRLLSKEGEREAREAVAKERRSLEASITARVTQGVEMRTREYKARLEAVEAFEGAFGGDFFNEWKTDAVAVGTAARMLSDCAQSWGGLEAMSKRLAAAAATISQLAQELKKEVN